MPLYFLATAALGLFCPLVALGPSGDLVGSESAGDESGSLVEPHVIASIQATWRPMTATNTTPQAFLSLLGASLRRDAEQVPATVLYGVELN